MKVRIDVIMITNEKNYEAPSIVEELVDERDIVTASPGSEDNDVDIGDIIFWLTNQITW